MSAVCSPACRAMTTSRPPPLIAVYSTDKQGALYNGEDTALLSRPQKGMGCAQRSVNTGGHRSAARCGVFTVRGLVLCPAIIPPRSTAAITACDYVCAPPELTSERVAVCLVTCPSISCGVDTTQHRSVLSPSRSDAFTPCDFGACTTGHVAVSTVFAHPVAVAVNNAYYFAVPSPRRSTSRRAIRNAIPLAVCSPQPSGGPISGGTGIRVGVRMAIRIAAASWGPALSLVRLSTADGPIDDWGRK